MTWTAPEVTRPEGSLLAPEAELLPGLLDWHRATFLHKCAGLTGEQLAAAPVPWSNLSLLGLIRHLAKVEHIWFRRSFLGEDVPKLYSTPERPDADFEDLDPARAEADYALLLEQQELARKVTAGVPLDTTFENAGWGTVTLRLVFNHMIGEYARHNGHADMVRQGVDGATGA
ncbi:DinB family protein [Nonomuraea sp. NPDC050691]|uniref:DinB family protein n=1 Tax=Nonomuraea sp. NPDC050691 TaxID=3155661 RepID=UPI0033EC86FA